MRHTEIGDRAGVSLAELNHLLQGNVSTGIADRLGVAPFAVASFLKGNPSVRMTERLGLGTPAAAKDLATAAGPPGATGVIIGLLFSA